MVQGVWPAVGKHASTLPARSGGRRWAAGEGGQRENFDVGWSVQCGWISGRFGSHVEVQQSYLGFGVQPDLYQGFSTLTCP